MNVFESDEVLKLDNQLCFALYALSRKMTQLYRPLLDEIGITYPQYLVLLVLWEAAANEPAESAPMDSTSSEPIQTEKGVPIKFLCERLLLDTGTLTPLLKRLEAQGLILRKRSVKDEREVRIQLSTAGEQLKAKVRQIPGQMLCKSKIPLDQVGPLQQQLSALLRQLD